MKITAEEIVEVRSRLGLTQEEFARRYGLELYTLQAWEQGHRTPRSASAVYLSLIKRHPHVMAEMLDRMTAGRPRRERLPEEAGV